MLLFVASIFLSAFLLFLVQPLVGKQILPWFGGGSGVWTVCLTFYQSTLFLGYAYAHLLVAKLPPARRVALANPLADAREGVKPMNPDFLVASGELERYFPKEAGWTIEHNRETNPAPPSRRIAELVVARL